MKVQRQFIVTVTVEKDLPDLIDHVAGRVYTLAGVRDATAVEVVADSPQRYLIDAIVLDLATVI